MMRPIFAYAPQAAAVAAMIKDMGLAIDGYRLISVETDMQMMRGYEDATFIEIVNHGARVPDHIRRELLVMGYMHVTLSDEFCRAKHERRARRAEDIRTKGAGAVK